MAENLPNSCFFEFPGRGHPSSIDVRACPFEMALAFLADPLMEPDSACVGDMTGPDFFVD